MRTEGSVMAMMSACALFLAGCASFYYTSPTDGCRVLSGPTRLEPFSVLAITVSEAAGLAVKHSPDLHAERQGMDLREGAWKLGLRSYFPSLVIGASSDERLAMFGSDSFTKTISISITQPVWDGGRLAVSRALESAEILLARAELNRKSRDVGEAAVTAYRSVIAARARLGIKHSSLQAAASQREILATELRLGLVNASELMEADLKLASMEIGIVEAELNVSIAEAELAESLGLESLPELLGGLNPDRAALRVNETILTTAAVLRSFDLEVARYMLAKKQAEVKTVDFAWLPTVGLKASGQVSGTRFPLTEAAWSIGLSLDFSSPFLGGGTGVSGGGELPHNSTARKNLSLKPIPDPAAYLESRNASLALILEEERYALKVRKVERVARSAVVGYYNSLRTRDIAVKAFSIAVEKLRLVTLQVELGKSLRSVILDAELVRSGKELELVDSLSSLMESERVLERLLDIPPDTLADYIKRTSLPVPDVDAGSESGGL